MVETTAVQSEQESEAARARRAEEKTKALKMEVIIMPSHHFNLLLFIKQRMEYLHGGRLR